MNFSEFQHLARLYVVGALDEEEMDLFEGGRREFGEKADTWVAECRRLESVFALSLQPLPPRRGARQRLLGLIQNQRNASSTRPDLRTRAGKDRPLHRASESDLVD